MANQVKARRKQLKLTQEQVAKAAGTTKATIMKLEKGDMQLTERWLDALSGPLSCRPEDLIAETLPEDVPLIGDVQDKGVLAFYRALPTKGAGEPEDYWHGLETVERPPEGVYRQVRALRVTGDALEPFLPAGSLVYYADPSDTDFDQYLNQMVVCALEDGRILLRRLQQGNAFGRYHLLGVNTALIEDVALVWCAKVVFLKP